MPERAMEVEDEDPKPVAMGSPVRKAIEGSKAPEREERESEDEEDGLAGGLGLDEGAAGASTNTAAGASTPSM
jgi:hypothetical protein